jgi:hypothetical protein
MSELVRRLELGEWAAILGSLSIILLVAVFLTIAVRYFLLPKASLEKMAMMPFDDEPPRVGHPAAPSASDQPQHH